MFPSRFKSSLSRKATATSRSLKGSDVEIQSDGSTSRCANHIAQGPVHSEPVQISRDLRPSAINHAIRPTRYMRGHDHIVQTGKGVLRGRWMRDLKAGISIPGIKDSPRYLMRQQGLIKGVFI